MIALGLNVRPTAQEAWRASVMGAVEAASNTIAENNLEVDRELVRNLMQAAGRRRFTEMATAADIAATIWQREFGEAPGWSFAPGTAEPRAAKIPPAPVEPLPPHTLASKTASKPAGKPKPPNGTASAPATKPVNTTKRAITPPVAGSWVIRGKDRREWVGRMTLKATSATSYEGYIDWSSEDGRSGREIVTATYAAATRRVEITGKRLENNTGNLGLGHYTAELSSDGTALTKGTWGGASTGTWSAAR